MWRRSEMRPSKCLASKGGALQFFWGCWLRAVFRNWHWLLLAGFAGTLAGLMGGGFAQELGSRELTSKRESLKEKAAELDKRLAAAAINLAKFQQDFGVIDFEAEKS